MTYQCIPQNDGGTVKGEPAISALHGFDAKRLGRIARWMDALVSQRKLPGASVAILKKGALAFTHYAGSADIERGISMAPETIVRIKSMTKPMTSVAIMMLYEEGRFQLDDPISRFLPYFTGQRVVVGGNRSLLQTVPARRDITFRDLLTHTAGLTYGFMRESVVDELYREAGVDFQLDSPGRDGPPTASLAEMVERAATMPLVAQPGTAWNYSIATDILGHLVSVISGQPYEQFMRDRLFVPLGMTDTSFTVPREKAARFAAHYGPADDGFRLIDEPMGSRFAQAASLYSGGGGIVSTASDYLHFCEMLLNNGVFGSERLLGRKTIELMTKNHLHADLSALGQKQVDGDTCEGIGFGLGFSVMLAPERAQILGSAGEFSWWGSAGTVFWVDPREEMAVVFLTQLTPSALHPIRRELRVLVYQAIS